MNASFQTPASQPVHSAAPAVVPMRESRNRDFGVGYGRSSGYFHQRRYAGNAPARLFRVS